VQAAAPQSSRKQQITAVVDCAESRRNTRLQALFSPHTAPHTITQIDLDSLFLFLIIYVCHRHLCFVPAAVDCAPTQQLEQVQTAGPRNQTVHHAVHTSSSIGIATSCMRQVQQDTAASATALVCLHVSCPAGHIPAVSAGSEVLVNFTSRNQRDHAR
jgi:hypothetical protein